MATRRLIRKERGAADETPTPRRQPVQRRTREEAVERASAPAVSYAETGIAPYEIPSDGWLQTKITEAKYREYEAHRTKDDVVHVSDLIHGCMRQRALQDTIGVRPKPRRKTLQDRLTFAQGDATHDVIKQIMAELSPDEVFGNWRCACKTLKVDGATFTEALSRGECDACGTLCDNYEEVSLRSEELGLVAHPDLLLLVRLDNGEYAFLISEIKSMAAQMWKDLGRPLPEHVQQVTLYWKIMRENGYIVTESAMLQYANKDWSFSGYPIKEYTTPASLTGETPVIRGLVDEAKAYKRFKEDGTIPPRVNCQTSTDTRAKGCDMCEVCFAM